jgi:fibronectin type 3 domain-containing protein
VPVQIGTTAGPSEFVDPAVQYDKTYEYSVQAVRQAGDREAESLVSAPVQVSREDRFAPAVPRGLTAVAGTHSVELAWTPSPETDLAGYRVYRAIEGGKFERLAELIEVPSFSDRSAERGKRYSYAVTSIDQLGNESDRSEPLEIVAQ